MRDFLAYAEFEAFWDRFQPETPGGRAIKDTMAVHRDAEVLEGLWDDTEAALKLLQSLDGDVPGLSRLRHHLKRIPRLPDAASKDFDEVEVFQFKKFLHNYKNIVLLLDDASLGHFGLRYESESLEALLDKGRQSPESFYVSDAYSEALARARRRIEDLNQGIEALRQQRVKEIHGRWALDFGARAFLVVPRSRLGDAASAASLLLIEPFDHDHWTVRPLPSGQELTLLEERTEWLARERNEEDAVLAQLSKTIHAEMTTIEAYRKALTRFDLAFARARLAKEEALVRPTLHQGAMSIAQGRFIPCQEHCQRLGMTYMPLDARFDEPSTVIFGSNMGGKTVVLKTVAFLQLCVQTGLFAPATSFATRLFSHFLYLGEGRTPLEARGLSGFGCEIRSLAEAWPDLDAPTLALFDEFARTTNSREAEALLSAVVEALATRPVTALFSTHFRGVKRLPGAAYLRMKGLDRAGLASGFDGDTSLEARLRLVDAHMDFRLVPDDPQAQVADAIAVAGLLGLDGALTERAAHFFHDDSKE
ncbi:MAG: hypothetical protein LWX11_00950 [Firmicutes bacterium]|nr:hypothetical protein [Bacillota bacterium]